MPLSLFFFFFFKGVGKIKCGDFLMLFLLSSKSIMKAIFEMLYSMSSNDS